MNKIIKIIFVFVIPLFTFSCGENPEKKQESEKTEQSTEHQDESDAILKLDNGNLWTANSETTEGIKNMGSLMSSFTENGSLVAYTKLAQDLELEFGTIITKCTMKGEAHNQLHNYLIPMKSLIKGLKSSDIDVCKENYDKLNIQLSTYVTYFK